MKVLCEWGKPAQGIYLLLAVEKKIPFPPSSYILAPSKDTAGGTVPPLSFVHTLIKL